MPRAVRQETVHMFENLMGSKIDRRSFLKGSAMFAAVIGVSVALPAFAQELQKPAPGEDKEEKKDEKKKEPKDPFGDSDKKDEKKLVDDEGREYRVCPQCGNNMYKQGRMWVCENCGYSYVE
ncbi:MAG: twin-arginine translocation signal domain-containing protein [Acidobacteriota bacterium]